MKWPALVTSALSAASLLGTAGAVSTCSTYYGTKPTTKVPTKTVTTTVAYTYATVITTVTRTTTEPVYTFTSAIGSTTTTIPVGPSFTPIISARSLPSATKKSPGGRRAAHLPRSPHPKNAKALREAAAAAAAGASSPATTNTHWPQSVVCTATTSTTTYLTRPYSTSVRSATTARYATTTTHVATVTVHAACQPAASNIITHFGGSALSGISFNNHYQLCGFGGDYQNACMDPRSCCELAQDYFSGWRFDNATGYNRCVVMLGNDRGYGGGWIFYDGENDDDYFFGNGAYGGGTYGGVNPDPDCESGEGCVI